MKNLKDFDVKDKRVLVRCDFNVPLDEEGNILDSFRIEQTIPTIKYLIEKKAKVILMSHLGNPEGDEITSLRLGIVADELNKLGIPVKMAPDCIGEIVEKQSLELEPGQVLLLENLRFYSGEENNDIIFSKELAKLGDIYINDAFGVCHRKHASVVGITEHLDSGIGLLLEKEIEALSRVLKDPKRPLVAIIGGAKIESKIEVIKTFLEKADHLLIGGITANTILIIKGMCIGRLWPAGPVTEEVKGIELTSTKLHLPIDVTASIDLKGSSVRNSAPGKAKTDELILDIGEETIKIFITIIKEAKMIVWSGPMGLFENPLFANGTQKIAEAIANNEEAFKIVGGGDTIFALNKFNIKDKIDHVSTGGGAMLKFLSEEELPGLEAL